jgi:sugar/nucleoside kinase (ribokinase family)
MTPNRSLRIGIGEVLWDLLPAGKQLGGASATFGYHAHALGAESRVVSAVGGDPLGREILDRLASLGLSTDLVATVPAPTGTVSVRLDAKRIPEFIIHEHVAWDAIAPSDVAQQWVGRADAVCFGTLAQRSELSRNTIRTLVKRKTGLHGCSPLLSAPNFTPIRPRCSRESIRQQSVINGVEDHVHILCLLSRKFAIKM